MGKRPPWLGYVVAAAVILMATPVLLIVGRNISAKREFARQLELARKEGLPTTPAEYAAHVPTAEPSENAGPLYRKLKGALRFPQDVDFLSAHIAYKPTPALVQDAQDILDARKAPLTTVEQAVKLPKCWFERDWNLGAAVLMPEYADMKAGARLLVLRGTLAVHRGDSAAALADIERILKMADHQRSEPNAIAILVAEALDDIAIKALASWGDNHRDQPVYRKKILEIVDRMPKPDVRRENLGELMNVLSIIDLCATEEGRLALGLKEDDISQADRFTPLLVSPVGARAKVVEAMRLQWEALALPPGTRRAKVDKARQDLSGAMLAYGTAGRIYGMLGGGEETEFLNNRETEWEARRVLYRGLARYIEAPTHSRSMRTSDLLSPFDQAPLSMSFDGEKMVFTVSGSDRKVWLPPSVLFAKERPGAP